MFLKEKRFKEKEIRRAKRQRNNGEEGEGGVTLKSEIDALRMEEAENSDFEIDMNEWIEWNLIKENLRDNSCGLLQFFWISFPA